METERHGFGYGSQSGVDGSRTRVQKPIPCPSTIIVCFLTFPSSNGNKHPFGYGSLYYLTEAKTFFCSCSPLTRRSYPIRGAIGKNVKGAYAAFKETVLLSVNFKVVTFKVVQLHYSLTKVFRPRRNPFIPIYSSAEHSISFFKLSFNCAVGVFFCLNGTLVIEFFTFAKPD